MNVNDLIGSAPDLLQMFSELGLSAEQVDRLGAEVERQLGSGVSLTNLLTGCDAMTFIGRLDVAAIAERLGIDGETARTTVAALAVKVEQFTGDKGSLLESARGIVRGLFDEL